MENLKSKKELEKELNEMITEQTLSQRSRYNSHRHSNYLGCDVRAYAPLKGYKLVELPNNKPVTCLNVKEQYKKDFVCFVNVVSYSNNQTCFNFWDINEDKSPKEATTMIGWSFNYKEARKQPARKFLIINKDFRKAEKKLSKHFLRFQKWINADISQMRFYYNDFSFFNEFLPKIDDISVYYFSHNSLNDHQYDAVEKGLINYNGIRYETNATTRQETFAFMFDKSGYFVLGARDRLNIKLKEIKRKKAFEETKRKHEEWKAKDKTNYICELLKYKGVIIRITEQLATGHRILFMRNTFERLKDCKNLCDRSEELIKRLETFYYSLEEYFIAHYETFKNELLILINCITNDLLNEEQKIIIADYVIKDNLITLKYPEWASRYNMINNIPLRFKTLEELTEFNQ